MIPFSSKIGEISPHTETIQLAQYFKQCVSIEEGSFPIFFEWFKNSKPLKPNPDVNYKIENSEMLSTLKIIKIDLNDVGNYTCIAKNTFGSDSQTIYL